MALGGLVNLVSLEKAILEIVDKRGSAAVVAEGSGSGSSKIGSFASGITGKTLNMLESADISGLSSAISAAQKAAESQNEVSKKRIEVQFNPSELSFNAYGGRRSTVANTVVLKSSEGKTSDAEKMGEGVEDKQKSDTTVKENKTMPNADKPPRIEMRIPLIFDAMNASEAFHSASNELSMYSVGSTISSLAKSGGTAYTVQPQVEAFLATLRCSRTRNVNFCWGKMIYSGVLNSVNVNYSMFSMTGKPVRARVEIGILLCDSSLADPFKTVWYERYKKAFTKSNFSDYSSSSVLNSVSFMNVSR